MKKYLVIISGLIFCGQIFWILTSKNAPVSTENAVATFPDFTLPSLYNPTRSISQTDLKSQNIRIINFFASWCGPCKLEHPLLMDLTRRDLPILGISYQDNQESARMFLENKGNPYQLTAWDKKGMMGASWGIMSIPQTFVVDGEGQILFHRSGRLRPDDISDHILPLFKNTITKNP